MAIGEGWLALWHRLLARLFGVAPRIDPQLGAFVPKPGQPSYAVYRQLSDALGMMNRQRRALFCAACAERCLPQYERFQRHPDPLLGEGPWDSTRQLQQILAQLWRLAAGELPLPDSDELQGLVPQVHELAPPAYGRVAADANPQLAWCAPQCLALGILALIRRNDERPTVAAGMQIINLATDALVKSEEDEATGVRTEVAFLTAALQSLSAATPGPATGLPAWAQNCGALPEKCRAAFAHPI